MGPKKSDKSRSRSKSQSPSRSGDFSSPGVTPVGKGKRNKKSKGGEKKSKKKSKSKRSKSPMSKTPKSKQSKHRKGKSKSSSSTGGSGRKAAGGKASKKGSSPPHTDDTATGTGTGTGTGGSGKKKKSGSMLCGGRSKKSKKSASRRQSSGKSAKKTDRKKSKKSEKRSKGGLCRTPKKSKNEKDKHKQKKSKKAGKDSSQGRPTEPSQPASSVPATGTATGGDTLTPTDLNIPNNPQAKKFLEDGFYRNNPPITAFGKYSTQLTARALCNRGVMTKTIVCSPTLRAIQTGDSLAKFLKAKLVVEPGLIEPLAWYRATSKQLPNFHLDKMAENYSINTGYSPVVNIETLAKNYDSETEKQGVSRVDFVLRSLAGEQRSEPLVIVGHAITLAVAAALGQPQTDEQKEKTASSGTATPITSFDPHGSVDMLEGDVVDRVNLGLRFPPGSVLALNQVNKGPPFLYQLTPNVVPPLSYGELYTNRPIIET